MSYIQVNSEIGELEGVILHTPGIEIEMMTPSSIEEALYSDLLNLNIAQKEYSNFSGVLNKWTKTYQVKDLLSEVLENKEVKAALLSKILQNEKKEDLFAELIEKTPAELSTILIEGYKKDNIFVFNPLYNLFFTRDASSSVYDKVLIHSMSTNVRDRESYVMEAIFKHYFSCETINPKACEGAHTEGGDVLIAREDVLFIGNGCRTNKAGIDFLTKYYASRKERQHIIVQELPEKPESFIHLDMVFTMLAKDRCMIYEPIIRNSLGKFNVTHIEIDNGQIYYHQRNNMLEATKKLGFDFSPVLCGGDDYLYQDREQWHSGANFFALGEGKILGYARNTHTIEALNNAGFEVLKAEDVCGDKVNMRDYERFVVAFDAAELPRGGGGARCMTMPIKRKKVDW
ncbi:MAG: arginine deiminase [Bacteroidales bacterium]|jgi:arginine deiminase|nr:arginine deiminase [Bacteroidales bacterium]MEE0888615.1 arginine deiminase family protein [Bacteroidales bacterium]MEE1143536.1 arginine deiminase family protein [Bacteroidales bacterium]MEE1226917.1 arginine deiminase family protein [Bacteroidales bacterium]